LTGARAVITGLGVVAPLGVGNEAFWTRLMEGAPELVRPRARDGVPAPTYASVFEPELAAERHFDRRALRKISNLSRATTVATAFSVEDAGLDRAALAGAGCVFGTAFGSSAYHLEYHERLRREGLDAAGALLFTQSVFNAPAGHASQVFGFRGPSVALVGGEAVGLEAILLASDRVRLGRLPLALAGGGEESFDLVTASLRSMGLVGDDLDDTRLPVAEGACIALLEPVTSARARAASPWGAILGSGQVGTPGTDRLARAAELALTDAGLGVDALDLVVAGSAVEPAEWSALDRRLTRDRDSARDPGPRWTAPQTWIGEGFAFTSAALVAVACLARRHAVVPPTRAPERTCGALARRFRARPEERAIERVLVVAGTSRGSAAALVLGADGR